VFTVPEDDRPAPKRAQQIVEDLANMSKVIKLISVTLACSKNILAQASWQSQVEYSGKTFFDTQVVLHCPESTYRERTQAD